MEIATYHIYPRGCDFTAISPLPPLPKIKSRGVFCARFCRHLPLPSRFGRVGAAKQALHLTYIHIIPFFSTNTQLMVSTHYLHTHKGIILPHTHNVITYHTMLIQRMQTFSSRAQTGYQPGYQPGKGKSRNEIQSHFKIKRSLFLFVPNKTLYSCKRLASL